MHQIFASLYLFLFKSTLLWYNCWKDVGQKVLVENLILYGQISDLGFVLKREILGSTKTEFLSNFLVFASLTAWISTGNNMGEMRNIFLVVSKPLKTGYSGKHDFIFF